MCKNGYIVFYSDKLKPKNNSLSFLQITNLLDLKTITMSGETSIQYLLLVIDLTLFAKLN
jgi:hypothetical protein